MSKATVNDNIYDFIYQTESMIQFDKDIVSHDFTNVNVQNPPLEKVEPKCLQFGIINLKIKKMDPSIQKRHFVFTVDCSGSMSDICNDGRTKMDHANHTLINMMNYFAQHPELMVSITVFAFDSSIYNIITNEEVREDNLDKLIQDVKKIRPKDMTNIEQALINSKEYISSYIKNITDSDIGSDVYVSNIFMTDGDATQGETLPNKLKEYVSPLVSNIFIGFGIEHNAYLLKELAFDSKNNYYFVDELEKAGLVYGEILHSIIYRVLENTTISVLNGLIYDWKKNNWVYKIEVGDLISETNKTYHVLSDKPSEFACTFQTTNCVTKKIFDFTIQNIIKNVDLIEDGLVDLTQYKYRQRTQQLLFEVNQHNFNKVNLGDDHLRFNTSYYNYNFTHETDETDETDDSDTTNSIKLKEKMKCLLKEMQQFLEHVDQKMDNTQMARADPSFIKLLCDDLYICLKTFDTKHSAMFSCARQLSQGAQRAYSATCTPKAPRNSYVFDVGNFGTPIIKRSTAGGNYNNNDNDTESFISKFPDFNDDELNNDNFNKDFYQIINDEHAYDHDDSEYNLSSESDNPYSTLSILDLMRSCSNNNSNSK
jgi:Mg-chelatase subunit ChlD